MTSQCRGLTDDTLYYVEASYDNTYPAAETEDTTFTTEAVPVPDVPEVTSVQAVSVGETTVTLRVNVVNADGSVVFARYSDDATFPVGSTTHRASTISAGDSSHDFAVVGLDANTVYYVEASYDSGYPDAGDGGYDVHDRGCSDTHLHAGQRCQPGFVPVGV